MSKNVVNGASPEAFDNFFASADDESWNSQTLGLDVENDRPGIPRVSLD
jgi:hypothetical protein